MNVENGKPRKHIIDQATFDEAVKENVELLDMESLEAINEAKTQFTSQNVDLSNIITDAYLYSGIENHPFVKNFKKCKELFQGDTLDEEQIISVVESIVQDMDSDKAKKLYAGNNGGYSIGMELLRDLQPDSKSSRVLKRKPDLEAGSLELAVLIYLKSVLNGYPDLLSPKDVPLVLSILERYVVPSNKGATNDAIISRILDLISATLVLHENNRELWSASPLLLDLLSSIPASGHYNSTVRMLKLLRAMTLDDDIRVEIANTHERVRKFSDRFLPELTRMVGEVSLERQDELAALLVKTVACLVVRNEHCAVVADSGGVRAVKEMARQLLTQVLERGSVSGQSVDLAIALSVFLKTIAGNDDVKSSVGDSGLIGIMLELVTAVRDRVNASRLDCVPLYEAYLLLLATLSLRHAAICGQLLEHNVVEVVLGLMRENAGNAKMVKYGSWTLRNICSRNERAVETLLGAGGAEVLETALRTHPAIGYDIKNAMKELGDAVDVKLDEQWTGKGQLNFKPEF